MIKNVILLFADSNSAFSGFKKIGHKMYNLTKFKI